MFNVENVNKSDTLCIRILHNLYSGKKISISILVTSKKSRLYLVRDKNYY